MPQAISSTEPNRAHEHDERPGSDVADEDLAVRHQPELPRFVLRVHLLELSRDAVHLTLRLRNRDAGRQAAETAQEVEAAHGRLARAERDGPPHLDIDHFVEERRQDADDSVRAAVDGDAGAEDAGVLPEALLPESVRDDDDVVSALLLVGPERSSQDRLNAEGREEVGRGDRRRHALRSVPSADHGEAEHRARGERREDGLSLAVVEEVRRRDRRLVAPSERTEHVHELLGPLVGQRLQEHRVDDAEHRAVGADSDAQGEHDEHGECRAAE